MVERNREENESLFEKSMQLMVNIIKLSTLSVATVNLRDKHDRADDPARVIPIKSFQSYSSNSKMSKSKRPQTPLSKSYLKEENPGDHHNSSLSSPLMVFEGKDDSTDDEDFSNYIKRFHTRTENEVNTDGKTTAKIIKFHEKNSRDHTLAASTSLPLVVRPPPPAPC